MASGRISTSPSGRELQVVEAAAVDLIADHRASGNLAQAGWSAAFHMSLVPTEYSHRPNSQVW